MSDDGLVTFLRARYDEEEAWIRNFARLLNEVHLQNADTPEHRHASVAFVFGQERFDPSRLLREVEAKRATLAQYERSLAAQNEMLASPAGDKSVTYEWENGRLIALLAVMKRDTAEYSDHPDYQEDWKP